MPPTFKNRGALSSPDVRSDVPTTILTDTDDFHGMPAKHGRSFTAYYSALLSTSIGLPLLVLVSLASLAWVSSPSRRHFTPPPFPDLSTLTIVRLAADSGGPLLYASASATGQGAPARLSFWHDLPLYRAEDDPVMQGYGVTQRQASADGTTVPLRRVVYMVCEIPAGTMPKYEIQKEIEGNPIRQDVTKTGAPRSYAWPSLVNYGALPRTYEHPRLKDHLTGLAGDGDPLDVMDVTAVRGDPSILLDAAAGGACTPGEVYPVRLLGALAMLEGGVETDWKLIGVRVGGQVDLGIASQDLGDALPVVRLGGEGQVAHGKEEDTAAAAVAHMDSASSSDEMVDDTVKGPGALRTPPLPDASPNEWREWLGGRVRDIHLWLRDYKKAEGKPVNGFGWSGAPLDSLTAARVVRSHHEHWCGLLFAIRETEAGQGRGGGHASPLFQHGLGSAGLRRGQAAVLYLHHCARAGYEPRDEVNLQ